MLYRRVPIEEVGDYTNSHLCMWALSGHPRIIAPYKNLTFIGIDNPNNYLQDYYYFYDDDTTGILYIYIYIIDQIRRVVSCKKERLSEVEIVLWIMNIWEGIEYGHSNGIHHGRLNSSLVFIDKEERVKVGGFACDMRGYVIKEEKRYKEQMKENLIGQTEEEKEKNIESWGLPEETLNMVVDTKIRFKYPLPQISDSHISHDILSILTLWIELYIFEECSLTQIQHYIPLMPIQWQSSLFSLAANPNNILDLSGTIFIFKEPKMNNSFPC